MAKKDTIKGNIFKQDYAASKKTGMPPGSPVYIGDQTAQKTKITLMGYDEENLNIVENPKISECVAAKQQYKLTWINISGLDSMEAITDLCNHYELHPLVIEDIFNTEQRPKIDIFDDYLFITMRAYTYDQKQDRFMSEQVSLVLGENYIITIQENPIDTFVAIKERLKTKQNSIRQKGADYLAHALIDMVVDNYFKIVEVMGDDITELENKLSEKNPDQQIVREIHAAKRETIYLRKAIWPLREIVSNLQRRLSPLIKDETILYLKDVYDHILQIIDTVETYRDFLAEMLDTYLSSTNNKLNEVMKVLTVFASIFIPLTFVTGLYGMNFNTSLSPFNMPELQWRYGYFFSLGIMLLVAITMLIFFKRKKWW